MRGWALVLALCLLATVAAAPSAMAGASATDEATAPALDVVSVDSSDYPQVRVVVSAPRALADEELDARAFTLLEDGAERTIRASRVSGATLDVVLVIDTSGSMRGRAMAAARAAATDFLGSIPEGTRVAIVAFSAEPVIVSRFTDEVEQLARKIAALRARGGTALFDAAALAGELLAERDSVAQAAVLLTDGDDSSSLGSLEAGAAAYVDSDISLHTIKLQTARTDIGTLEELAQAAGGVVADAEDASALAQVYTDVAADVANQYVLTYKSAAAGFAQLQVGVDAKGVTATATGSADLPPPRGLAAFLSSRSALITGSALCYLAMALLILNIAAPRDRSRLLMTRTPRSPRRITGLSELAEKASRAADASLQRHGKLSSLNRLLERAGINLRPGEFVVLCACAVFGSTALGYALSGALLGLSLGLVALMACRVAPKVLAKRRQARFAEQLSDTLQLLAGALRAGYGLLQAVDAVAQEAEAPTSEEFRRLVVETRLGRDLSDSLKAMADRADSQDFEWVVQAIEIHREVGGDLADVLDTVAGTIRERNAVRRQIQTLSAEGKLSALILLGLPFVVTGFIYMTNPSYMGVLFTTAPGVLMLSVGGVLMAVGALWMRKLVKLDF